MAPYPYASEVGALYTLVGPDGSTAVFNYALDANYVGMLSDVSGLDSPDVRESAQDLVEADGGVNGNFYFGRRPITMTGLVYGHTSIAARAARLAKARQASLALRGDAILSWKPAIRQENLLLNPKFFVDGSGWALSNPGGLVSITGTARVAMPDNGAQFGYRLQATQPNDSTVRAPGVLNTNDALGRVPVVGGETYTASVDAYAADGTTSASDGARASITWVDSAGATISTTSGATTNLITGSARTRVFVTGVAPANAVWARVSGMVRISTANEVVDFYFTNFRITPGTVTTYFDGDTAGGYWAGNAGVTASGDFIEMYVPVRRQQPWRESGAWNKTFQLSLVADSAVMLSKATRTASAAANTAVPVDNRGSYTTFPILTLTGGAGGSTAPTITCSMGGKIWTTSGLVLAAGETVQFDTLRHTATFTNNVGSRIGTSAAQYVDWVQTTNWGSTPGNQSCTYTPSAGALLSVAWQDAWV